MNFMDECKKVINQLIEDEIVIDINDNKDLLDELLKNNYSKEDAEIRYTQTSDNLIVVEIPYIYGSPDTRLTKNKIVFYIDDEGNKLMTATDKMVDDLEFPYTDDDIGYIDDVDTEWFEISLVNDLEDYMIGIGLA